VPWGDLPRDGGALFDLDRLDDVEAGGIAARSIERAARMALDGQAHAVVTAPIHKPSLKAAGWDVPGHTEMLQALSGSERVGMLMAAERTRLDAPLRVLLATTHIRLCDVADRLTVELLTQQSLLLNESLRTDWGIRNPRLALCALNPHASYGGLFGDEEARILEPAVAFVRAGGGSIDGPIPADTVFQRALSGEFDAVIAPYHDVGMAAFKTVAFGSGVNVPLGLPFVRTSPDHGTAFDIAGTGRADPASMLEAIRTASRLARARFDTDSAHV
jgi:4-hydroxythreonine-4-phosphate dehydrogenase